MVGKRIYRAVTWKRSKNRNVESHSTSREFDAAWRTVTSKKLRKRKDGTEVKVPMKIGLSVEPNREKYSKLEN